MTMRAMRVAAVGIIPAMLVVLLVPIDRSLPFNLLGGGNNHRPSFERLSVVRWFLGLEILEKFHSQVPILVNPIYCDV